MSKGKVIGFEKASYESMKKAEEEAYEVVGQLESLAKVIMGDKYVIKDYEAFLKHPFPYLLKEFKEAFYKHLPEHFDPELALKRNVNLTAQDFADLQHSWKACLKTLGVYSPTVTAKGLKANVKEDNFNVHLDQAKAKEWEALTNFVEAAEKLSEVSHTQMPISLVRFCPKLMFDYASGSVTPNPDSCRA